VRVHEPAEHDLRMKVCDHRLLRSEPRPIAKLHTGRAACVVLDPCDRRLDPDYASLRLDEAGHRANNDVRAARADDHAEGLVRHRLEIREKRAARGLGRKVEVHAPGGHHSLDLWRFEMRAQEIAWAREQEATEIEEPRCAL